MIRPFMAFEVSAMTVDGDSVGIGQPLPAL